MPRREEACAVCACKDWLSNRYEVYLFKEATGVTTWAPQFRFGGNDEEIAGEDDGVKMAEELTAAGPAACRPRRRRPWS